MMDRRRFLRALPSAGAAAVLLSKTARPVEKVTERFETITDHKGWWGVPGAVWQLVTHEFGQTWARVR